MSRKTILLFHPQTLHERNYRYYHVPYSLLSIASVIDRKKYELVVIDNNVQKKNDYHDMLTCLKNDLLCVGVSSMIGNQIREGLVFSQTVRQTNPDVPIIWGGALPTILSQKTVEHEYIDIIVRGQGEAIFEELVNKLFSNSSFSQVKGISYKTNGQIIHNPDRVFLDLNNFPRYQTVYDLIDLHDYIRFDEHINTRTVSYHSSQGCPFNCGFCCETTLWNRRWSGLTASRILDDMKYLVSKFLINGIKFYDSEFFVDSKRVFDFIEELLKRKFKIRWYASVHPNNLACLTEEQFRLLKQSGASRLLIGAESGVQRELNLIEKKTHKETIFRLAELCSKYDIVASFTFIIGYPLSSSSDIEATIDFAEQLRKIDQQHECKIHFYAPYPGTPLYSHALQHGFIPPKTLEEWSYYDYYGIVTPWIDRQYENIVREFNEKAYPYLHPIDEKE